MTIAGACVEAGAQFLDRIEPGWFKKIEIDIFDISDGCNCILGQIHGDYIDGLIETGIYKDKEEWLNTYNMNRECDLGFDSEDMGVFSLNELDLAWIHEIQLRLTPLTVDDIAPVEAQELICA